MYYCVCHTCAEDKIIEDFDRAQDYFNDHADRQCAVELRNVATAVNRPTTEPSQSDTASDDV